MNEEMLNTLEELSKKEITSLALNIMELTADNMIKDKEIDRLNNIINELEKWLNEVSYFAGVKQFEIDIDEVLLKLKELKEDNK